MGKRASERQDRTANRVPADVSAWRWGVLCHAGFEADLAERLAADPDYDLHSLLNLVDHGCPPPLAARILAPL
jgi:hypothetical protein